MLTDEQIEHGKTKAPITLEHHHEHNDCIRLAYEWLDAQQKLKNTTSKRWALKHVVEKWAGRYISQSDMEVAAWLHPEIKGKYPYFNISSRLTLPSENRLIGIGEAGTQLNYREQFDTKIYKQIEDV